jgi:hypothetical protein
MNESSRIGFFLVALCTVTNCDDGVAAGVAGSGGSGGDAGGSAAAGGSSGANATDADSAALPPCAELLCETFDGYSGVSAITNGQVFGPWRAAIPASGSMTLDGTRTTSGARALHVHVDAASTGGGRLLAQSNLDLFANDPTHLYGRMMMYVNPGGTSAHWTFFGASGEADPNSPVAGRRAQYLMSSLSNGGQNTYAFVYGLQSQGADGYHDCSSRSSTSMPASWACISFDLDSVSRRLRLYKDGGTTPILSVDEHGTACVAPTPIDAPWYGPVFSELYIGALSFDAMDSPLDVWIDDLVLDTKPVTCPTP